MNQNQKRQIIYYKNIWKILSNQVTLHQKNEMGKEFIRQIFYYKKYYLDFFEKQNSEVKKKFNWTLQLIATIERIPQKFFKHITDSKGIYEIRIEVGSDIYRVFSFFDSDRLIIVINGYRKKSQKTSKNEIEIAEKIRKEYFDEKEHKQ